MFGLILQINRESVSIASNISEGSSRISAKDFSRFIEISLGSAFESETQLLIAEKRGYIKTEVYNETIKELVVIQKQLNALLVSLKPRSSDD